MREDTAAERLRSNEYAPGYVRPEYQEYSFANVTPTIADCFGVESGRRLPDDVLGDHTEYSNVLVVLLDGVRYDRWLETEAPLFRRARDRGRVTPLTSVYPSETAAAMTTYQTGKQPIEHGLLGWEQYFRSIEETVEPLKGRTVDRRSLDEMVESHGIEAFAGETIHSKLASAGIESTVVNPGSTLTHAFAAERYRGATQVSYGNPSEGAVEAVRQLDAPDQSFVTLYIPDVDSVCHRWGTRTPHYEAAMHMLSAGLERAFRDLDPSTAAETLVMVTADHGHVDTGTEAVGSMITDVQAVAENLERGPDGLPVQPTGGARNVHLHLQDGTAGCVQEALRDFDALVWTQAEAIEANLFGDRDPSELFQKRCGDVIVVPNGRPLWYDERKFEHVGQHGGLHPDEMLVPFTAVPLSDLVE